MSDQQAQDVEVNQQLLAAMEQAWERGDKQELAHLWNTEQQLREKQRLQHMKLLQKREQLWHEHFKAQKQLLLEERQLLNKQLQHSRELLDKQPQQNKEQLDNQPQQNKEQLVQAQLGMQLLACLALARSHNSGAASLGWTITFQSYVFVQVHTCTCVSCVSYFMRNTFLSTIGRSLLTLCSAAQLQHARNDMCASWPNS